MCGLGLGEMLIILPALLLAAWAAHWVGVRVRRGKELFAEEARLAEEARIKAEQEARRQQVEMRRAQVAAKAAPEVIREKIIEREVLVVKCDHCGKRVRLDGKNCPNCGALLEP